MGQTSNFAVDRHVYVGNNVVLCVGVGGNLFSSTFHNFPNFSKNGGQLRIHFLRGGGGHFFFIAFFLDFFISRNSDILAEFLWGDNFRSQRVVRRRAKNNFSILKDRLIWPNFL